jgi:dCTP diphosphatase
MEAFVAERGWQRFHTPRNLLLALTGEVGEVAELFQWRADDECRPGLPAWSEQEKEALGDELADVLLYLMRLATVSGINLDTAVLRKLAKNRAKYRPEQCFGSSAKYTSYTQQPDEAEAKKTALGLEEAELADSV